MEGGIGRGGEVSAFLVICQRAMVIRDRTGVRLR